MTTNLDLPAAIAAARGDLQVAIDAGLGLTKAEKKLRDLLAALDAAQGEAVAWLEPETLNAVDPEAYRSCLLTGDCEGWFPVYSTPQAPPAAVDGMAEITRAYNAGYKASRIELGVAFVAAQQSPPAAVVPADYTLGETIYTPPSEEVRFCYSRGQPNNVNASRLGEACRRAAEKPGGDYIDGGLSLLKELEARGYGVFRFAKSGHEQAPPAAVPADRMAAALEWIVCHADAPERAARGPHRGMAAIKHVAERALAANKENNND